MITILLTREEILSCKSLAEDRNVKAPNIKSQKIDKNRNDYIINFFGLLGELAFSKYMNIDIDTNINQQGGDNGYDFKINDKTIDIKHTRTNNGGLIFKKLYKFKADIAILTKPVNKDNIMEGIKLCGWIYKEEYKKKVQLKDLGFGSTYYLSQRKLHKIESLKKYLGV